MCKVDMGGVEWRRWVRWGSEAHAYGLPLAPCATLLSPEPCFV